LRAEQQGRDGEAMAADYLKRKGFEILAERVKTKLGEIDLVAKKDALIAFVEAKVADG
jgi:putative endonuclease